MKRDEFEAKLLKLWTTTRIPLTRANLQVVTGAARRKVDGWLDELVSDGMLEMDADDEGELIWTVRGAARPERGFETVAEWQRYARLSAEVGLDLGAPSRPLAPAKQRVDLRVPEKVRALARPTGSDQKSVVASGLLSLFLGPIGWIYAAPLKEALPAILIQVVVYSLIPRFILFYLMGPISALSAIVGVLYALSYNHTGERTELFGKDKQINRFLPPRR